ncbi:MAG: tetratricopeptide repeat protein [Fuerstiella sp.]|nr:tetratricopeptide repeat protein [Fuerstiella sp.]MCP4856737.1 tetratricopeptide repeat protein [Fuerstiella sp.]
MSDDRRRRMIGVFICVVIVPTTITSGPVFAQEDAVDPVATREYAVALGFQKKKLFKQAAVRWTQFIAKFAKDKRIANAHYHLGVCQLQTGNARAVGTFQQVLRQFEEFKQRDAVQFNLGLALYNAALASQLPDDFRAAAAEFAKVSSQHKNSKHIPAGLYYQAECVFQAGDHAEAIAVYQTLIAQHSTSPLLPTAIFALATTQQTLEQSVAAVQTYRMFLQKFPKDSKVAECRLRLGLALTALTKHAEAEKEFAIAAAVSDFAMADLALFHQARAKYEQKQLPQAAGLFESLPNRFNQSEYINMALLEGGKCRFLSNQFPQAQNAFKAVVDAKQNESAEAAWWLGRTLIQLKQAPAAIGILDRAIADWPQTEFVPELKFTWIEAIYEDEKRRPETVTLYAQFADEFADDDLAADARFRAALTALQLNLLTDAKQQSDAFLGNVAFAKHSSLPDVLFIAAESRIVGDAADFAKADELYRRLVGEFPEHAYTPRSLVRVGFCLHSLGRHDPGIAFLKAALPKLMESGLQAESQFLIGISHLSLKRPTEAITALRASRQAKNDWGRGDEVVLALARGLVDSNQPDAAIAELNQLNQKYPESEFGDIAWFRLGEIQVQQKELDAAVVAFQQVVERFSDSDFAPLAAYGSGSALFDKADYKGAVSHMTGLLTKYPTSDIATNAYYLRGLSEHRQKNYVAAVSDLTEFLKREPKEEKAALDARYSLVLCHAGLEQHDQTIQTALDLLKTNPDYAAADKVWYELAFAYSETSRQQESAGAFRQLATKFPDSMLAGECWLRVAGFHASDKQYADAIAASDQGLAKTTDPVLRERLQFRKGSSQFSTDGFDEAAATLQAQIAEHPDGDLRIDATWLVAESMFRLKKYGESLPWYQKSIETKSEKYQSRALYRIGTCANELKQWPVSQKHFEALTKQFPEFEQVSEAWYGLGFALQNQNQLEQAMQMYERVTRETNTESAAKARFMMGECAFAQKKYDVAWEHFLEAALGYPYPEWQALGHFEAGRCFIELQMPDKARESLQTVVDRFPKHVRAKDAAKLLAGLKAGS